MFECSMRVTRMQLECESIRAQVACKPHTTKHFMHSSHTLPAYKQDCLQVIIPFRSHAEACDLDLCILLACGSVRFGLKVFCSHAEACDLDFDNFACVQKRAI